MISNNRVKLMDCTLRDGGYYTNWDFDDKIVKNYYESMEKLPIDYVEIGYRSFELKGYYGEFFYTPEYVMKYAKEKMPSKKLTCLLDVKNIEVDNVIELLEPCKGYITLIRLAVAPTMIKKAVGLAKLIKALGFEVAFNVMYLSDWMKMPSFLEDIPLVEGIVDYFYMVDSYGGITPDEVIDIIKAVKSKISTPLGFHGHNNLELGLINTLTAIEQGCIIVDSTITGMGRGAGNLKTELLLTYFVSKYKWNLEFNYLSMIVQDFEVLMNIHKWGTSLPYMVSGASSHPQKEVMDWIGKRTFSIDSIITAIQNKNIDLDIELKELNNDIKYEKCIIIGGGESVQFHQKALREYLKIQKSSKVCLIHVSSKNAFVFNGTKLQQYFCLIGNEGYRMKKVLKTSLGSENYICVLPPYPRRMGTYIPPEVKLNSFQLKEINFTDKYKDNSLTLALQLAIDVCIDSIVLVGFDGYLINKNGKELELQDENEYLLRLISNMKYSLTSLTKTNYKSINVSSIYSKLID